MTYDIPFNRASVQGSELEYVRQAIAGGHISGDGPFTKACEALLQRELSAARVLLTTSCTHALELAALLLDLGPGNEAIVPSFTFVSTANAVAVRGARPVFADIRPDTLNLDEASLERLTSDRTRAVIPVHYAGVGCAMEAISSWASATGAAVIEDNAHGLFARYRDRPLGTFGQLATLSFHETKNLTCGEGGALVVNDARFVDRAEILREKGTDRSRFFRGAVDKYSWRDLGSSYVPSDMLAAFLLGQLEKRDQIQSKRKRIWERYERELREWAGANDVRLPLSPGSSTPAYHMFFLVMPSSGSRDALISHLRQRGILSVFHYLPLHLSEMGRRYGGAPGDCPVAEDLSARLLRLPFFADLEESDQKRVVDAVRAFEQ
jgi:dTDP-4-amino-4,6-dideoxygalactose transaminase